MPESGTENAKKYFFIRLVRTNYLQVLFVVGAFTAMVLISYFYVASIVSRQMYTIGEQIMLTTQNAVTAKLESTEFFFGDIYRSVKNIMDESPSNADVLEYIEDTQEYFSAADSPIPEFLNVYGFFRGEFLDASDWEPPEDYVPTERPWYIVAAQNPGELHFTEPYIDADTGQICISYSRTLDTAVSPSGYSVLSLDINLSAITKYISEQKITNEGYGVLISDSFHIVTHGGDTGFTEMSMEEVGAGYKKLYEMLQKDGEISAERFMDYDGEEGIAFFRKLFVNGWYIGIITDRDSYVRPVRELAWVIMAVGLILSAALCYLIVRTRYQKMRSDEESLSKSTFLARMSHEMRTPMNAIIGMTEIARGSSDPQRTEYCLDRIRDASKHLLGVINDVLDMSKIEADKLELSPTDFLLTELIAQVNTVIGFKIDEKKQDFKIIQGADVPIALHADKQRLAQVIMNLLGNANKFTPDGGEISLKIEKISESADGKTVLRFEITDTGIGISPEQKERLFKSFEQADGSISRKFGGTGLGLAISKRIVDLMGGEMGVNSELGHGSTFFFTVCVGAAVVEEDIGDTALAPEEESGSYTGKTILLAEDVEINREIIIALLEDTGIEFVEAENGQIAVEIFSQEPERFDMIFMDIHMPLMDGYEAARRIRALPVPKAKSIPIIALTANVFKEDVDKCLAAGMNSHTGKPIEYDSVMSILAKFLK